MSSSATKKRTAQQQQQQQQPRQQQPQSASSGKSNKKKKKKSANRSKSSSSSSSSSSMLVGAAFFVALAVLGAYFALGSSGPPQVLFSGASRENPKAYPDVVGKIQILDYGVTEPRKIDGPIPFKIKRQVPVRRVTPKFHAADLIERKMPVVLKNSVVSTWESMGKWSPEYFRDEVHEWHDIERVKRVGRSFINYELGALLENVTPETFWENYDSRAEYPMTFAQYYELTQNHTDDHYWYYAEEVPKRLLKQCAPRSSFKTRDKTWVYQSVWMGEGGATTAAHFDIDDNFYVQFYGRKRFLLFHPKNYKRWLSYPRISVNHKQVQMRRGDPSRYSYLLRDGAPLPVAYEAILEPGDVLYIPAYWYHHVEAMTSAPGTSFGSTEVEHLSISANFWSTSHLPVLISISSPGPMEPGWDGDVDSLLRALPHDYPEEQAVAAIKTVYLNMISTLLFGKDSLAYVAQLTIELRYKSLFGVADPNAVACPPRLSARVVSDLESMMEPYASRFADSFKEAAGAAIQEIEFLNYLELTLDGMVELRHAYPYLAYCVSEFTGQDGSRVPAAFDWF